MSITTTSQTTDTDLERAAAMADGLRKLAQLIEGNPDVAKAFTYGLEHITAPIVSGDEQRSVLATVSRAVLALGGTVDKYYMGDQYAGITASLGPVSVKLIANREQVCERVVIGTREVTKQVPDPDALASVPTVTVTETVEDVKWVCSSLLAEATDDAQSGRAA